MLRDLKGLLMGRDLKRALDRNSAAAARLDAAVREMLER